MQTRGSKPAGKEPEEQRSDAEPGPVEKIDEIFRDRSLLAPFRRLVSSLDDRMDMLQAVVTRWLERGDPKQVNAPKQYFRTALWNEALDRLKKRKFEPLSEVDEQTSNEPSPEQVFEREQKKDILKKLIAALPKHQRTAMTLWIEGMEVREIAVRMGRKEHQVRRLMTRATIRMKAKFEAPAAKRT